MPGKGVRLDCSDHLPKREAVCALTQYVFKAPRD